VQALPCTDFKQNNLPKAGGVYIPKGLTGPALVWTCRPEGQSAARAGRTTLKNLAKTPEKHFMNTSLSVLSLYKKKPKNH